MPVYKCTTRLMAFGLMVSLVCSSVCPPALRAEILPAPGTRVDLSPAFTPAYLMGITVHPDNPLQFDFLVNQGDGLLGPKKQEYTKLIKYFLASLTLPDKDQWVNLSPYEKNHIIENRFGKTQMGRDLLSQDYLLKQLASSLMYPESGLGKSFWDKVYAKAWQDYHTTEIPVNTFNKVWIIPDKAVVYESGSSAYVLQTHLKVMLEEDYLALRKHTAVTTHTIASPVIREVILPELEKEVNNGRNFAPLRQVVSSMVLAAWYKKALKESLLGKIYADKAKLKGLDAVSASNIEAIYRQYLAAFKKGVYNYIKEDIDQYTRQPVPRKYFAGGFENNLGDGAMIVFNRDSLAQGIAQARDFLARAWDKAKLESVGVLLQSPIDAVMGVSQKEVVIDHVPYDLRVSPIEAKFYLSLEPKKVTDSDQEIRFKHQYLTNQAKIADSVAFISSSNLVNAVVHNLSSQGWQRLPQPRISGRFIKLLLSAEDWIDQEHPDKDFLAKRRAIGVVRQYIQLPQTGVVDFKSGVRRRQVGKVVDAFINGRPLVYADRLALMRFIEEENLWDPVIKELTPDWKDAAMDTAPLDEGQIKRVLAKIASEFSGLMISSDTKARLEELMFLYLKDELKREDLLKMLMIKVPALGLARREEIVDKLNELRKGVKNNGIENPFDPFKNLHRGSYYIFVYQEPSPMAAVPPHPEEGYFMGAEEQSGDTRISIDVNGATHDIFFSEVEAIKERIFFYGPGQEYFQEIYRKKKDAAMVQQFKGRLENARNELELKTIIVDFERHLRATGQIKDLHAGALDYIINEFGQVMSKKEYTNNYVPAKNPSESGKRALLLYRIMRSRTRIYVRQNSFINFHYLVLKTPDKEAVKYPRNSFDSPNDRYSVIFPDNVTYFAHKYERVKNGANLILAPDENASPQEDETIKRLLTISSEIIRKALFDKKFKQIEKAVESASYSAAFEHHRIREGKVPYAETDTTKLKILFMIYDSENPVFTFARLVDNAAAHFNPMPSLFLEILYALADTPTLDGLFEWLTNLLATQGAPDEVRRRINQDIRQRVLKYYTQLSQGHVPIRHHGYALYVPPPEAKPLPKSGSAEKEEHSAFAESLPKQAPAALPRQIINLSQKPLDRFASVRPYLKRLFENTKSGINRLAVQVKAEHGEDPYHDLLEVIASEASLEASISKNSLMAEIAPGTTRIEDLLLEAMPYPSFRAYFNALIAPILANGKNGPSAPLETPLESKTPSPQLFILRNSHIKTGSWDIQDAGDKILKIYGIVRQVDEGKMTVHDLSEFSQQNVGGGIFGDYLKNDGAVYFRYFKQENRILIIALESKDEGHGRTWSLNAAYREYLRGFSSSKLPKWEDLESVRYQNLGTLNAAMQATGGIDLNSANLDLQIRRDGRGMPLPWSQQDLARFSRLSGVVPVITGIKPVAYLPVIDELRQVIEI